jgi:hypothetical protein
MTTASILNKGTAGDPPPSENCPHLFSGEVLRGLRIIGRNVGCKKNGRNIILFPLV